MSWHDSLSKKFQTRKPNKFGAEKVTSGGRTFDSGSEHEMFETLKLMERGGLIKEIVHHPGEIALTRFVSYHPDFRVFDVKRQTYLYIEFKGFKSPEWRIKRNLYREFGKLPLQIWKKEKNRIYLHEEIIGIDDSVK